MAAVLAINVARHAAASRVVSAVASGLEPLRVEAPVTLSGWAARHFYLSAESSYTEGRFVAYPFQVAIMDCMGHDDIVEIDFMKSARVGYTKMVLAAVGYFAEHKKRNQALWQPSDADRDEFTKVELEPMLRDVPIMEKIFPAFLARHKDNTLKAKKFLTGMLHLRGGTAAKNYRRISVDVCILDELDGFDQDIEGEGSPFLLAFKRLEGAVFPKIIAGTTPKTKNLSHIEDRVKRAQEVFVRHIPCPHCGHMHPITWGGKGEKKDPTGFVWRDDDPETAGHICPGCGVIYTQSEYLSVWDRGRWINPSTGVSVDPGPVFRDAEGEVIPAPAHVAFLIWTAYSPQATWPGIVREFVAARARAATGDKTALKTFTNTTLGEPYEEEVEKGDAQELMRRVEPYPLRTCPREVLVLVAFVDVQGDRFELVVWGVGRGEQMWVIDYRILDDVNPFVDEQWEQLDEHLARKYRHAGGGVMGIEITGVDTGYATHQAYRFCRQRDRKRVHATKGETQDNRPIKSRRTLVDVRQRSGKPIRNGCKLHWIGTDAAKDTIWGRLQVEAPGPGYVHFSAQLPPAFFEQLVSEVRIQRPVGGQHVYKWVKPHPTTRNEVLDCTVGALWGLEMLVERYRDIDRFWDEMERRHAQHDIFTLAPDAYEVIPDEGGGDETAGPNNPLVSVPPEGPRQAYYIPA
ncbi:phage terminase large subunit family protein [Methylolobus aquaticus]